MHGSRRHMHCLLVSLPFELPLSASEQGRVGAFDMKLFKVTRFHTGSQQNLRTLSIGYLRIKANFIECFATKHQVGQIYMLSRLPHAFKKPSQCHHHSNCVVFSNPPDFWTETEAQRHATDCAGAGLPCCNLLGANSQGWHYPWVMAWVVIRTYISASA